MLARKLVLLNPSPDAMGLLSFAEGKELSNFPVGPGCRLHFGWGWRPWVWSDAEVLLRYSAMAGGGRVPEI